MAHHSAVDEFKDDVDWWAVAVLHDVVVEDTEVNEILILIWFEALKEIRNNSIAWVILTQLFLIFEESECNFECLILHVNINKRTERPHETPNSLFELWSIIEALKMLSEASDRLEDLHQFSNMLSFLEFLIFYHFKLFSDSPQNLAT